MPITEAEMLTWCRRLLGADEARHLDLEEYLDGIPRLDALSDLPPGTRVLVRGDVDAKPGANVGEGDVRLRSMQQTLNAGRDRGFVQVIFGHIGRKPEGSLDKVAARLAELLGADVPLVGDWWDESKQRVSSAAESQIREAQPGAVLLLENTRRYDIERTLWKAKPQDLSQHLTGLTRFANAVSEQIADVYVHEALSAGSLDSSSTVVPAAMSRVALGKYLASELEGPMLRCRRSKLVIFSGLKIDKLDDLEAIINRGQVEMVIAAGSLAMSLKKADARLAGGDFCLGVAEDPNHADKPYYISPERVEQASGMLAAGHERGLEFVLPLDFVLADGEAAEHLGPADQQFDVGPKSRAHFESKVSQFIASHARGAGEPAAVFHNGVFGMFEDKRFEAGTRDFVPQLKRMKDAGLEVYVGGGEGGKALDKYGQPDWVTHCFTAGGTVLNALGNDPIPYLQALYMAAHSRAGAASR